MIVYVAAPFSRAADARRAMVLLQAAGHEIARDWTVASDEFTACGDAPAEVRARHAGENLAAVLAADAFLLLTFDPHAGGYDALQNPRLSVERYAVSQVGRGCHSELGAALCAQGATCDDERPYRVLVCGPDREANAFALLAERYETLEDAVFALGIGDGPPTSTPTPTSPGVDR